MNQAWLDFLLQEGLAPHHEDFGSRENELAAPTTLTPLLDSALIRATGEDNAAFLHNLMTNDVTGIPADGMRTAGFCTPKGRLLATFTLWHEGADLWLMTAADVQPAMLKRLSMYILRSKAKLHDGTDRVLIGLAGAQAATAVQSLEATLPAPQQVSTFAHGQILGLAPDRFILTIAVDQAPAVWASLKQYATPAGLNAWRRGDIAAGRPRVVAATQEQFIPQMINFEVPEVGGVSFKKGCYPGQEIVARTQYLGKIKRRMYRVTLPGTTSAGADLYAPETGDQSCGNVVIAAQTGADQSEALVVLQASTVETGEVHLGSPDGPRINFMELPYTI